MQPQSAKQEALKTIESLPDNVNLGDIVYRLYVLDKIERGVREIDDGQGISSEELKHEIEQW